MAEAVSFWICKCGKAVDNAETKCPNCGDSKPFYKRRSLIAGGSVAIFGILFLAFASGDKAEKQSLSGVPGTQKRFNSIINQYADRYTEEENPIERKQILSQRNEKLADTIGSKGKVSQWKGTIRGISVMNDGASVSIDIGSAELISGQSIDSALRSAIQKGTDLYEALSTMREYQEVTFSGSFVQQNSNGVRNLNWYDKGEATAPEFHFNFNKITPVQDQ